MRRVSAGLALSLAALATSAGARADEQAAPPTAPTPPAPAAQAPAAPTSPAPPAPAPAPSTSSVVQLASLRDLHERGVLSDDEYRMALKDIGDSTGDRAADAMGIAIGKWTTTLYGFAEGDYIYDTTQSFNDAAGNAQIVRPNGAAAPLPAPQTTYAGNNGRTQFSIRNSRFGLRVKVPGTESVRTSGMLEMDFLGSQSIGYPPAVGQVSEQAYFTSPLLRVRHAMFRVETPVVDVLVGQYWHLLGWQGTYHPNTVEIQGVPGELYARTPQLRLSKTIHADPITVEIALAALRPPARDSVIPDMAGGVRVAVDSWTGMQTAGATNTSVAPASIALTGDYRVFQLEAIDSVIPTKTVNTSATSVAADAFLPVLPATKSKRDNALSLTGEVVYGAGIADLYSNLTRGVQFPVIPNLVATNPLGINPFPGTPQNIDNGLVDYDITKFALHPIQWTSFMLGLQYYLPFLAGKVWVSGNYSHMTSRDGSFLGSSQGISNFARSLYTTPNGTGVNAPTTQQNYYYNTSAAQVRSSEDWWDANVFVDPTPGVRVGLELAEFIDHYLDGFTASSIRGQVSGFFIF